MNKVQLSKLIKLSKIINDASIVLNANVDGFYSDRLFNEVVKSATILTESAHKMTDVLAKKAGEL